VCHIGTRCAVASTHSQAACPADLLTEGVIRKKPAPDLIRAGHPFSEKIML